MILSQIILDNTTAAEQIPKDKAGRFILHDGTVFQGFWIDETDILWERRNIIENIKVPIHLKVALTIKEAAEYSNIGINKIDSMLRTPNCPFVLFVGTKKLVKRKEFEQYISERLII